MDVQFNYNIPRLQPLQDHEQYWLHLFHNLINLDRGVDK